MGVLKRIFGWILLFLGANGLVNCFVNAPYNEGGVVVGFIAGGLIFTGVCFYFGARWIKKEK